MDYFSFQDDPLSSLDNEVGKYLFENGIKNFLVKHNRTTILVTQKLQLVYNAENVSASGIQIIICLILCQ